MNKKYDSHRINLIHLLHLLNKSKLPGYSSVKSWSTIFDLNASKTFQQMTKADDFFVIGTGLVWII